MRVREQELMRLRMLDTARLDAVRGTQMTSEVMPDVWPNRVNARIRGKSRFFTPDMYRDRYCDHPLDQQKSGVNEHAAYTVCRVCQKKITIAKREKQPNEDVDLENIHYA